jgi:hypothetical protein
LLERCPAGRGHQVEQVSGLRVQAHRGSLRFSPRSEREAQSR